MNRKQESGSVRHVMGRMHIKSLAKFAERTGRWFGQVGAATATLACIGVFADPGLPRLGDMPAPAPLERSAAH